MGGIFTAKSFGRVSRECRRYGSAQSIANKLRVHNHHFKLTSLRPFHWGTFTSIQPWSTGKPRSCMVEGKNVGERERLGIKPRKVVDWKKRNLSQNHLMEDRKGKFQGGTVAPKIDPRIPKVSRLEAVRVHNVQKDREGSSRICMGNRKIGWFGGAPLRATLKESKKNPEN